MISKQDFLCSSLDFTHSRFPVDVDSVPTEEPPVSQNPVELSWFICLFLQSESCNFMENHETTHASKYPDYGSHIQTLEVSAITESRPRLRNCTILLETHGISQQNGIITENGQNKAEFAILNAKMSLLGQYQESDTSCKPLTLNTIINQLP